MQLKKKKICVIIMVIILISNFITILINNNINRKINSNIEAINNNLQKVEFDIDKSKKAINYLIREYRTERVLNNKLLSELVIKDNMLKEKEDQIIEYKEYLDTLYIENLLRERGE